jgi:hypothetical protein
MISQFALGASILLFLVAAMDQWFAAGNLKLGLLNLCFALTSAASYWLATK